MPPMAATRYAAAARSKRPNYRHRPTPAVGTVVAQWPMYFVSGRSQISSSNAEFGRSSRCRITAGDLGELQPNGRTSSRRRFAIDPKPSATVLRTGHRNRSKPPFELRHRRASTFSDWMPARKGKNRSRPRPAAAGGHRRRARSIRRPAAPVCPGLRVRAAHRLVAAIVDARLCTTLGLLVPAAAMRAAQARRHARTPAHRGKMPPPRRATTPSLHRLGRGNPC
jgi:hypothetical protein